MREESELDIPTVFESYRQGRRNAADEELSPTKHFKKDFFEYLIYVTLNSIIQRFDALQTHENLFSLFSDVF